VEAVCVYRVRWRNPSWPGAVDDVPVCGNQEHVKRATRDGQVLSVHPLGVSVHTVMLKDTEGQC
jgi:hypothetical protein